MRVAALAFLSFALQVSSSFAEDGLIRLSDPTMEPTCINNPLSEGTRRIERVSSLSLQDFFSKYADTQTPVIITDYSHCFAHMTRFDLERECGDVLVRPKRRTSDSTSWASIASATHERRLQDVLEVPSLGVDYILGVFDLSLPNFCPTLLNDFVVPKYFSHDYLQRLDPSVGFGSREYWPSLFIGANGSYGGAHVDTLGTSFWQYVAEGEKEWHIVDDTKNADYFARNRPVAHFYEVVGPGELLYIPGGTTHQVRNRGDTLSFAGNLITRGNLGSVQATINQERGRVNSDDGMPGSYLLMEETLLDPDFDLSIDMEIKDMTWHEFKSQARPW